MHKNCNKRLFCRQKMFLLQGLIKFYEEKKFNLGNFMLTGIFYCWKYLGICDIRRWNALNNSMSLYKSTSISELSTYINTMMLHKLQNWILKLIIKPRENIFCPEKHLFDHFGYDNMPHSKCWQKVNIKSICLYPSWDCCIKKGFIAGLQIRTEIARIRFVVKKNPTQN